LQRVFTTVTLLGLLVATAGAFAITEHLKLEKSPIFALQVSAGPPRPGGRLPPALFSPVCNCPTSLARIGLKLRHPNTVTVTIVDKNHHIVATRAKDKLLGAHGPQHFVWDGRTDAGALVPDGVYYPSLHLADGNRTFEFRNKITVDTQPPVVQPATVLKPVLFAGPGRSVAIQYSFSEKAHALVYLRGRRIILGHTTRAADKIKWNGRFDHKPLPAGKYDLSIGAQDLAGNETPAAGRKHVTVVVRYVELTPDRISVGSGGRLKVHVKTALRRYKWRLGRHHGERRGKVLRLRAPSTPGTYRLVVGQPGMSATAVVKVRK
jgi:hypothetical protein